MQFSIGQTTIVWTLLTADTWIAHAITFLENLLSLSQSFLSEGGCENRGIIQLNIFAS